MATFLVGCTEDEWQKLVVTTARACGWFVVHLRKARKKNGSWETPVMGDGKGFVDLILYGHGRVIHVELKTDTGQRTHEQVEWQARIERAGMAYRLWRPGDWTAVRAELENNQ
jgi:extradiol dioxygenase family protein